jgi:uncharacterized protein
VSVTEATAMSARSADSFDALPRAAVGIGLRAAHAREIMERTPTLDWLEIHSENYFSAGGRHLDVLRALRARYPVSAHGVGLSLGSADPLSATHLAALARLVEWLEPVFISEHLAWGAIDGRHANDLLPLPYTDAALALMIERVDQVQSRLGRRILIENVSSYVEFSASEIPEWEFLAELARRSGCGILLDVNNIDVAARNHGFEPFTYIDAMPAAQVCEIHVAGHSTQRFDGCEIVVDTHDGRVSPAGWCLLRHALRRYGPVPVLVEWDSALPPLGVLLEEAAIARACMKVCYARAA